jgi:hypothetical protein
MELHSDNNLYRYANDNPMIFTDPVGLLSQKEADRMECCELAREINDATKELKRLQRNQLRRADLKAGSPVQYWLRYDGHLIKWVGYQNRLRKLLKSYNDKNCTDDIGGSREWVDKDYPDFNWDEWRRRFNANSDKFWQALTPSRQPELAGPPPPWVWEFLR